MPSRACTRIQTRERGRFCENHIVEKGWGYIIAGRSRFREARVLMFKRGVYFGREGGFRDCPTVAYGCLKEAIF